MEDQVSPRGAEIVPEDDFGATIDSRGRARRRRDDPARRTARRRPRQAGARRQPRSARVSRDVLACGCPGGTCRGARRRAAAGRADAASGHVSPRARRADRAVRAQRRRAPPGRDGALDRRRGVSRRRPDLGVSRRRAHHRNAYRLDGLQHGRRRAGRRARVGRDDGHADLRARADQPSTRDRCERRAAAPARGRGARRDLRSTVSGRPRSCPATSPRSPTAERPLSLFASAVELLRRDARQAALGRAHGRGPRGAR